MKPWVVRLIGALIIATVAVTIIWMWSEAGLPRDAANWGACILMNAAAAGLILVGAILWRIARMRADRDKS